MSRWNSQARTLPIQLQAYRDGQWVAISNHHTEETAQRAVGRLRRDRGGTYRVLARLEPGFIH